MRLTKAQLQAIGHLMQNNASGDNRYMMLSEGFCGVYSHAAGDSINEIQKVSKRVIDSLVDKGLLTKVGQERNGGFMYKATQHLVDDKELHRRGVDAFGERATHASLAEIAEKYHCRVEFERVPKLFKLVRLSDRQFSSPYIDESENGVKVTRLTDLSLGEWETEIANCIKRSILI